MATNNNQDFTALDFFDIKARLKRYLSAQPELLDYNFDGSTLSVLLDVLAYNTQFNAFTFNMVASEMFLDSATRRDSVVSLSKALGYTPRSKTSAVAYIQLQIVPVTGTTAPVLPVGTRFTSTIDGKAYTFTTREQQYTIADQNGNYTFNRVEIVEGIPLTYRILVQENDVVYKIPNPGVDTAQLTVIVRDSAASTNTTPYTPVDNVLTIDNESNIYFIEEVKNEYFAIRFGDGVLGKKPVTGNVVEISYVISSGPDVNGAAVFALASSVPDFESVRLLQTLEPAQGGADIEEIESIRRAAPQIYGAQNRAVTALDYARIIKTQYPSAEAISVWGGEDNEPPQYGYVFISIKPEDGEFLSDTEKRDLETTLIRNYNVLTITPVILDPDYTNLIIETEVKYDATLTSKDQGTLETDIINSIVTFSDDFLEQFDTYFKFSKFVAAIDDTDRSVMSNVTTIKLAKEYFPSNIVQSIYVKFSNQLVPSTVISTTFTYGNQTDCRFLDDGAGNISIYQVSGSLVQSNVGTVNYTTGDFLVNNILIVAPSATNSVRIIAKSVNTDLNLTKNQILQIFPEDVDVTLTNLVPSVQR